SPVRSASGPGPADRIQCSCGTLGHGVEAEIKFRISPYPDRRRDRQYQDRDSQCKGWAAHDPAPRPGPRRHRSRHRRVKYSTSNPAPKHSTSPLGTLSDDRVCRNVSTHTLTAHYRPPRLRATHVDSAFTESS